MVNEVRKEDKYKAEVQHAALTGASVLCAPGYSVASALAGKGTIAQNLKPLRVNPLLLYSSFWPVTGGLFLAGTRSWGAVKAVDATTEEQSYGSRVFKVALATNIAETVVGAPADFLQNHKVSQAYAKELGVKEVKRLRSYVEFKAPNILRHSLLCFSKNFFPALTYAKLLIRKDEEASVDVESQEKPKDSFVKSSAKACGEGFVGGVVGGPWQMAANSAARGHSFKDIAAEYRNLYKDPLGLKRIALGSLAKGYVVAAAYFCLNAAETARQKYYAGDNIDQPGLSRKI